MSRNALTLSPPIVRRQGATVVDIRTPVGTAFTLDTIAAAVKARPRV
jgi:hypothetical protein